MKATSNAQKQTDNKELYLCWREAVDCFTDAEKLAEHAKNDNPFIRGIVAGNSNTAAETLIALSQDSDENVASTAKTTLQLYHVQPDLMP